MRINKTTLVITVLLVAVSLLTFVPAASAGRSHHGGHHGSHHSWGIGYGGGYYPYSYSTPYYSTPYYYPRYYAPTYAYPPYYGGGGFYYGHGHHGSSFGIATPGFSFFYH